MRAALVVLLALAVAYSLDGVSAALAPDGGESSAKLAFYALAGAGSVAALVALLWGSVRADAGWWASRSCKRSTPSNSSR